MGEPLTGRDAAARTFSHAFSLDSPRDPKSWPVPLPRKVPQFTRDVLALGQVASVLGKTLLDGLRGYAQANNIEVEGLPRDPKAEIPPDQILQVMRNFLAILFPLLAPTAR